LIKRLNLLLIAVVLASPALAEDMKMPMGSSAHAADEDFMRSMDRMMKDMAVKPTGDPDKDFVLMMMPHHQGAIDMAKVELQYGKDPTLRKLATDIVAAQQQEIALMKSWLASHSK
jgi:uncharacterized protein (DUF305 family)